MIGLAPSPDEIAFFTECALAVAEISKRHPSVKLQSYIAMLGRLAGCYIVALADGERDLGYAILGMAAAAAVADQSPPPEEADRHPPGTSAVQ